MKRVFFVIITTVFVLSTVSLNAQNRDNRNGQGERVSFSERQERMLKVLKDSLALNATQVTKIQAINKTYDAKFEALRGTGGEGDREAMREKMTSLNNQYNAEVKKVLTPEQAKKYDKLAADRRSRMSGSDRPGQGQRQGGNGQGQRQGGNGQRR